MYQAPEADDVFSPARRAFPASLAASATTSLEVVASSVNVVVPPSSISRHPRRVPGARNGHNVPDFLRRVKKIFQAESCTRVSPAMAENGDMATSVCVSISQAPSTRIASGRSSRRPRKVRTICGGKPTRKARAAAHRHQRVWITRWAAESSAVGTSSALRIESACSAESAKTNQERNCGNSDASKGFGEQIPHPIPVLDYRAG